jgi:hypothetical protein
LGRGSAGRAANRGRQQCEAAACRLRKEECQTNSTTCSCPCQVSAAASACNCNGLQTIRNCRACGPSVGRAVDLTTFHSRLFPNCYPSTHSLTLSCTLSLTWQLSLDHMQADVDLPQAWQPLKSRGRGQGATEHDLIGVCVLAAAAAVAAAAVVAAATSRSSCCRCVGHTVNYLAHLSPPVGMKLYRNLGLKTPVSVDPVRQFLPGPPVVMLMPSTTLLSQGQGQPRLTDYEAELPSKHYQLPGPPVVMLMPSTFHRVRAWPPLQSQPEPDSYPMRQRTYIHSIAWPTCSQPVGMKLYRNL